MKFCDSDFGTLEVVPNRFMRARDVLVLQTDMWAVAFLNGRRMVSIPLTKTGDSDRRQILSEYALVARNEKSSGDHELGHVLIHQHIESLLRGLPHHAPFIRSPRRRGPAARVGR